MIDYILKSSKNRIKSHKIALNYIKNSTLYHCKYNLVKNFAKILQ